MGFLLQMVLGLAQTVLAFYGFWLVWRVLLPWLPGPEDVRDRIAPYACFFTDPFLVPVARRFRLRVELVAFVALLLLVALRTGLAQL